MISQNHIQIKSENVSDKIHSKFNIRNSELQIIQFCNMKLS